MKIRELMRCISEENPMRLGKENSLILFNIIGLEKGLFLIVVVSITTSVFVFEIKEILHFIYYDLLEQKMACAPSPRGRGNKKRLFRRNDEIEIKRGRFFLFLFDFLLYYYILIRYYSNKNSIFYQSIIIYD